MVNQSWHSFYKGKKIFITGHTGFKGAWLVGWLSALGARVKGYALPPHEDDLYQRIAGDSLCTSVTGDIRDREKLSREMQSFNPDLVFHLAAQSLVRVSYEKPVETFDVNVTGTANVLHVVSVLPGKCAVVVVTTDKVYENIETEYAYVESDRLGGNDPYSASKAACELVTDSFRNSFFPVLNYAKHLKSLATARSGNVIGGGDRNRDRLVPDIVHALQSGQKVKLRNPTAVRPWQFVLDPLRGYLMLGKAVYESPEQFSGAWNFGPQDADCVTVQQLTDEIISHWGSGEIEIVTDSHQPHEAGLLKLNNEKAKNLLHWSPGNNLQSAVAKTISGYKQSPGSERENMFRQIRES